MDSSLLPADITCLERLPLHYESSALVSAPIERIFAHLDDQTRLSAHMSKSSWRMGGGHMDIEVDEAHGQSVGSEIRLTGRVLGLTLSVTEVVSERAPPHRKAWKTVGSPKLLVIGAYRMGFELHPSGDGCLLRVFIEYAPPEIVLPARWLGNLIGRYYAKWCTQRMLHDAVEHFSATV